MCRYLITVKANNNTACLKLFNIVIKYFNTTYKIKNLVSQLVTYYLIVSFKYLNKSVAMHHNFSNTMHISN